jgi:hypothetical protein
LGSGIDRQDIFYNTTIADLGITPGTYTWTWGTGAAQSFTITTTTPLPAALPLFATGLGTLGLLGWSARRFGLYFIIRNWRRLYPTIYTKRRLARGKIHLPAALPLFATALGGLGLLGWRGKRKAQAVV